MGWPRRLGPLQRWAIVIDTSCHPTRPRDRLQGAVSPLPSIPTPSNKDMGVWGVVKGIPGGRLRRRLPGPSPVHVGSRGVARPPVLGGMGPTTGRPVEKRTTENENERARRIKRVSIRFRGASPRRVIGGEARTRIRRPSGNTGKNRGRRGTRGKS